MEFKADEAEACRLALHALGRREPGVGRFFPTSGTVSSVGFAFPPLFVYVLALPLAIVREPVAAAAFIAATNVVAVWLCYVAGTRYFSRFVGLAAAAFFALSPWAIVYSRKIWSPDLLPICTCAFLIALHEFLVEKRSRAAVWLILLVGVAVQFHFSAGLLAVLVLAAFVIGRDALRARHVALGLGGLAVLYAPYLWYVVVEGHVYAAAHGRDLSTTRRLLTSLRDTLTVGFDDRISHVLGSQSAAAFPLSVAFGTISVAGLVGSCRGWRKRPLAGARALLVVWFILPLVALTVLPIRPFDHYFIVLYPLPFLGLALALETLSRRYRGWGWLALAGCLATFAVFDGQLFRTVVADGGAPGDYGVAYKYKADAVASFVRQNPARRFELGTNADEYRFLEWNIRGAVAKRLRPPARRYVLSTDFNRQARSLGFQKGHFGPLEVRVVPLR
jgi:4-amino-4-deoxy-L-arabinose transferase-like glycosyltransferase